MRIGRSRVLYRADEHRTLELLRNLALGEAFAAAGPPQLALTPDTIFQGTVTIGNIKSDGTPSRSYGFIKVDHTHNEVFWSEADVLDGYLSKGDRCEFRIVDAKSPMAQAAMRRWKATDVVCME